MDRRRRARSRCTRQSCSRSSVVGAGVVVGPVVVDEHTSVVVVVPSGRVVLVEPLTGHRRRVGSSTWAPTWSSDRSSSTSTPRSSSSSRAAGSCSSSRSPVTGRRVGRRRGRQRGRRTGRRRSAPSWSSRPAASRSWCAPTWSTSGSSVLGGSVLEDGEDVVELQLVSMSTDVLSVASKPSGEHRVHRQRDRSRHPAGDGRGRRARAPGADRVGVAGHGDRLPVDRRGDRVDGHDLAGLAVADRPGHDVGAVRARGGPLSTGWCAEAGSRQPEHGCAGQAGDERGATPLDSERFSRLVSRRLPSPTHRERLVTNASAEPTEGRGETRGCGHSRGRRRAATRLTRASTGRSRPPGCTSCCDPDCRARLRRCSPNTAPRPPSCAHVCLKPAAIAATPRESLHGDRGRMAR